MKIKKKLLVTPKDVKPSFKNWTVDGVFNPAAVRLPNKKIVLYARVAEFQGNSQKKGLTCPVIISEKEKKIYYKKISEDQILDRKGHMVFLKDGTCRLSTISHFRKIILDESGFNVEHIDEKPNFTGKPRESEYGVEDPRITKMEKGYYMTYVGISIHEGVSTYLAFSKDLIKWKRLGLIFREQNKDAVLFPEKFNGKYVALNRPESMFEFSKPGIWVSFSRDLIYWGRDRHLIRTRKDSWESERVGSGAVPIKTKKGWLLIYHGVERKNDTNIYSAGAILLDLKDPEKIIARSPTNKPLFKPTEKYEKKGSVSNVVFPTGAVMDLNKKDLLIYSGGADSVISVRKMGIKDIMNNLKPYRRR
ncbi:glycosidase [Candidatus Pacearchaeota archaeon]|nr:glycosidase [Candidatus Pacearchaeota archaeon]|tara:strand:- start:173 stop:1258 length:1086 start_codon:yes stop_codon:yes gene_type:complete